MSNFKTSLEEKQRRIKHTMLSHPDKYLDEGCKIALRRNNIKLAYLQAIEDIRKELGI